MACYECKICKKFIFQGGGCTGRNKKFNGFEEETRGQKIRTSFKLNIAHDRTGPVLKYGSYITIIEDSKETEIEVIKITYVDLENMWIGIEGFYFERDMPEYEKRRRFSIIEGVREK